MNKLTTAGAVLLATTSLAAAGGLDRSGQSINALFEAGNHVELSFGSVSPSVSGTGVGSAGLSTPTGNIAGSYTQVGAAHKGQLTENTSVAIIFDQPFGADVNYEVAGYILGGSAASVTSTGVTLLGRQQLNENFSVHGGLRYVSAKGEYVRPEVTTPNPDDPANPNVTPGYSSTYSSGSGTGFVIGGAYERKDIALRLAVTYSGEIDLALPGSAGNLTTTLPESFNIDFQTGIAADTLLLASVRHVNWNGFSLDDDNPLAGGSILDYDDDVTTYSVGVGRRFSDQFSGSLTIGYEAATDVPAGNLGPTDGYISYSIGGAYTLENGVKISGGVRYVDLGDAVTEGFGSNFAGNSAVGLGLKVGYTF